MTDERLRPAFYQTGDIVNADLYFKYDNMYKPVAFFLIRNACHKGQPVILQYCIVGKKKIYHCCCACGCMATGGHSTWQDAVKEWQDMTKRINNERGTHDKN